MEENARMEREAIITSRKGNSNQGCGSSNPKLHHELLQTPLGFML